MDRPARQRQPSQKRQSPVVRSALDSAGLCNLGVMMAALPAVLLGSGGDGKGPTGPGDGSGGDGSGGESHFRPVLDVADQPDDQDLDDEE